MVGFFFACKGGTETHILVDTRNRFILTMWAYSTLLHSTKLQKRHSMFMLQP